MELYSNTCTLKDGQTLTLRSPEEDDAQALIGLMQTADRETRFLAREPEEFSLTLEQEKRLSGRGQTIKIAVSLLRNWARKSSAAAVPDMFQRRNGFFTER